MNLGVTWTQLFQDAIDIYGTDLDELTLIRAANRKLDVLKLVANLPSQVRTTFIAYLREFERYPLPTDYKTEGFISLRYDERIDQNQNRTYLREEPLFHRFGEHFKLYTPEDFNRRDKLNMASIFVDTGFESLFLTNGNGNQTTQEINSCDSIDGWTAAGGAGNLTVDELVKIEGNGSLKFDLTSATAATLTLVISTAIDLSEFLENGRIPFFLWLPTAPTSIDIEIGETSSKYHSENLTTQADGAPFNTDVANELRVSFKDTSLTSTPDMTSVIHFKMTLNFSSAVTDTDFRIDNIKAWKPINLLFDYYSFYMVKESGAWQEYIDQTVGNSNIINILPEWRETFVHAFLLKEADKQGDSRVTKWEKDWEDMIKQIQRRYPNLAKRTSSFYW